MKKWKKEEFEEIEYKPRSVKEILTEMKDTSELIVDLAYSALIFNSEDIAKEVKDLEIKMDKLLYQIRLQALIAARSIEDAEQLSGILQVASASENISNAAGDIADIIKTEIDKRPFLPSILQDAEERIKAIKILESSSLVGKSLNELSIEPEIGLRIIAVKRGRRWIYNPNESFIVRAGDYLIVRGVLEGYFELKDYASGKLDWETDKVMPSAGEDKVFQEKMKEEKGEMLRARERSEVEKSFIQMKDTSELMVDLAYSSLLYNNKEIAEEIYALESNMDALNERIQRLAINSAIEDKNVEKALAIIKLATSIETISDSALEIADVVLRDIELHPVIKMSLDESDVIISMAKVSENSVLKGKSLEELKLASETGMWVIAIKRGDAWLYGPEKDETIQAQDLIIARGPKEGEEEFLKVASGEKREI